ncbi:shewanella-like protein phosphatase 2 [Amborella trichopoda]|uniref:shewanella-like protein phosphatase 2 n=1 Tax=Amborella trichopoda TaxID=13333 RepID=UPI0009BE2A83|nr:shewanella-like protein phosphatase 2 [Amborella trichopoda]|eukprot:XP_020521177.1 shewanella-like protein phosphatase 2 [Amborella trichopoda]
MANSMISQNSIALVELISRDGNYMVVMLGDILDRGGEELKLLYFLEKLKQDREKSNVKLLILQGNHERLNIQGDFRARVTALSPGSPISTRSLADNPTVLMVGGSVFVHGRILPKDGIPGT